jgi:hypothetical protein
MTGKFTATIVGVSVALVSLLGLPANAGGGGHGGGGHGGFSGGGHAGFSGGGHAGFSGGAHFGGAGRSYSGAGISHAAGSYGARHYSSGISTGRYGTGHYYPSGISTGRYGSYGQRYYVPRSSTGGQAYRSHPRSPSGTASRQLARSPNYSGSYYVPRDQSRIDSRTIPGRYWERTGVAAKRTPTTVDRRRPENSWSRQNLANSHRLDPQTTERMRNWQGRTPAFSDAKRNHEQHWGDRHHHGHNWWRHHCDAIVLVGWGFWGWYDGWWYPAWGYDPYYSYYDYNGPIYGYDGLQPDEIIADVQAALQQLGYYPYAVDGVLGSLTQAAIANYQRDYGLSVTGAVDPQTVRSLGLSG